jgi:HPt (histidine-containing phosphotransfer) domain-containing protein
MDHPTFNHAELLARTCGDHELACEILEDFKRVAGEERAFLRSESSLDDLRRHAHRLRGALLAIGAQRGARAADAVEEAATDRRAEDARDALPALHNELDALLVVLEDVLSPDTRSAAGTNTLSTPTHRADPTPEAR